MSNPEDLEDLEDEMEAPARGQPVDNLFDDDDDDVAGVAPEPAFQGQDEGGRPEEDLEDDIDDQRPNSGAGAGPSVEDTAEDRRAAMLKLVQKKRQEAAGGDESRKKKNKKTKKQGDDEGKGSKGSKKDRPLRDRGAGDAALPGAEARPRMDNSAELNSDEIEDDSEDLHDFIDNDDAGEGEQGNEENGGSDVDDEHDGGGGAAAPEEAMEVAPGEEGDEADDAEDPFGHKKKKRRKESESEMAMFVDDKIAKMEAAAEADMEQHDQQRPAFQKLKFLAEVEGFLAQKKYHELFISSGGLGVLKAWLEPYSDGSLPNARIRSMVLRACKQLPIDTSREEMKAQLKKSQLGNRVMFLLKCADETTANRMTARELVQAWSRPIFFDPHAEAEKRRQRTEALKIARQAAVELQREREQADARTAKPKAKLGEAGYRWHAAIPMASKLDYVTEPVRDERMLMAAANAQHAVPDKDTRFAKKMRMVQRKNKNTAARAAKPSVEGRSITIMHQ